MKRFWDKVKRGGSDECWPWQGARTKKGYGMFRLSKSPPKVVQAHRLAYELTWGPLGDNHALHACDNPPCCNPAHLREGTNTENVADRVERGRTSGGTPFHKVKEKLHKPNGQFASRG